MFWMQLRINDLFLFFNWNDTHLKKDKGVCLEDLKLPDLLPQQEKLSSTTRNPIAKRPVFYNEKRIWSSVVAIGLVVKCTVHFYDEFVKVTTISFLQQESDLIEISFIYDEISRRNCCFWWLSDLFFTTYDFIITTIFLVVIGFVIMTKIVPNFFLCDY